MINFDVTGKSIKEHNLKWSQILDHLCRILITGGSAIWNKPSKVHIYAKDPHEAKYQLLLSKREGASLKLKLLLRLCGTQKALQLSPFFFLFSLLVQFSGQTAKNFEVISTSWSSRHMWPRLGVLHWTHQLIIVSTSWNLVCVSMPCCML